MLCTRLASLQKVTPALPLVGTRVSVNETVWRSYQRLYAKARPMTLPALSPTMEEGSVVSWSKKVGDKFKQGEVLYQLQTDKAVLDVEADDDGVLAKIVAEGGSGPLPINALVGYFAEKAEDLNKLEYPPAPGKASKPAQAAPAPKSQPPQPPQQKSQPQQQTQQHDSHKHASHDALFPSVRRLLVENNLDVSQVTATGPQGRVVKGDVLNAIKNIKDLPAPKTSEASTKSESKSESKPAKPSTQSYEDIPNSSIPAYAQRRLFTSLTSIYIRTVIAKRLTESKRTNPHLYVTAECNIDQLLAMRARLNEAQKVKLSVNDFILKAAALTLRDLPAANVSWANDSIRQLKDIDVSVAVATDKGLITPIVKNTDKKGLATIATELKDLATRARSGGLKPHEFQGGSFSVSNLGMYGISHFSAVINPPQAAILAIGAGRQEVQLASAPSNIDLDNLSLTPSPSSSSPKSSTPSSSSSSASAPSPSPSSPKGKVVNVVDVTLSCDNRVIDEALANQFLTRFQKYMANPEMLVL